MDALFTPETLDGMCRLRDVFDPDRRANPGKVVPVRYCRERRPKGLTGDGRRETGEVATAAPGTVEPGA